MNERKQKLIEALKQECSRFKKLNHTTFEHEIAIQYLETGKTNEDPEEYILLDGVMNDFETTCRDYGVK